MHDKIALWQSAAPYSEFSPEQAQPTIVDYSVKGSKGAVIVCPGGGYTMKADYEGAPIAEMINGAGVSAFVLDYRVMPCHNEAPLADAQRAIRVVRSMGYEKVAILGFSAGGHISCAAATLWDEGNPDADDPIERISSRPDAFMPCYSLVSFTTFFHTRLCDTLLGVDRSDSALMRRFSAELNVNPRTPEAFIWHTSSDDLVPVEQSIRLASALAANSVPFELHVFPIGRHGLALAEGDGSVSQWTKLLKKWLIDREYD